MANMKWLRSEDLTTTVNAAGTVTECHIPGFAFMYEKYKDQNPTKFKILTETSWTAISPLWQRRGRFLYDSQYDEQGKRNAYAFIKFLRYQFTEEYERAFHRYKLQTRDHDVPMIATARMVHLGNTSFSLRAELRNASTGVHYGTVEIVYVHVSPETRRPCPCPDYFRSQYIEAIADDQEPVRVINVGSIPDDSEILWTEVTILPDMIDHYKHTNVFVYQNFAMNAVAQRFNEGHFADVQGIQTAADLNVKVLGLAFEGESRLGDVVRVGVWRSGADQELFHCVVKKGDQVLVTFEIRLFLSRPPSQLARL